MKYVLLILDGATDVPRPELEGRTPLMVARMPHLREMVRQGNIGVARLLPAEVEIDPEAALLACFGYFPPDWWTGRGPLEAAAIDVPLDRRDVAFRANLIHTDGERLLDPTAGRITDRWAQPLIAHAAERLRGRFLQLYPGRGYRHVLVWRDGPSELACANPREIAGEPLVAHYPVGDRADRLRRLMEDSYEILSAHPLNRQREDRGLPPATMIWPWGGGPPTRLPAFGFRHGLGGALIAGHPLVRGIGRLAGLAVPDLPEATGTRDTDYAVKAKAALAMLPRHDFVAIHVYAPHDAAQDGDWEAKIDALQRTDERLLGPLLDRIGTIADFRILMVVDHPSPCTTRRAEAGWTPFLLTGNREKPRSPRLPFDERAIDEATWRIEEPDRLLEPLFAPVVATP